MVWAVDGDDVLNACGDGKFAMMKEQMKILNKGKFLNQPIVFNV